MNGFLKYALSKKCADLWILTFLSISLYASARFEIPYVRFVTGGVLVLLGPGYALFRFIFIENKPVLETFTYSFGLSMVVVPLIGYALNYGPGIYVDTVMISVILSTLVLSLGAVVRRYAKEDKPA